MSAPGGGQTTPAINPGPNSYPVTSPSPPLHPALDPGIVVPLSVTSRRDDASDRIINIGSQVDFNSTDLGRAISAFRLLAYYFGGSTEGLRYNYAAAMTNQGRVLVATSYGPLHAEQRLISLAAERGQVITELYSEFQPCEFTCIPLLRSQGISNVTWSFPWNALEGVDELRANSRREREQEVRRLFDGAPRQQRQTIP